MRFWPRSTRKSPGSSFDEPGFGRESHGLKTGKPLLKKRHLLYHTITIN
jgi:hypothetical protein